MNVIYLATYFKFWSKLKDHAHVSPGHGLSPSARLRRVSCQPSLLLQEVISSSGAVLDYCYDTAEELWCQLTLKVSSYTLMHTRVYPDILYVL